MNRVTVIRLEGMERPDGKLYISSPDLPLFHILLPNKDSDPHFAFEILKEYMEKNAGRAVSLRSATSPESFFGDDGDKPMWLPAHVIAEAAA